MVSIILFLALNSLSAHASEGFSCKPEDFEKYCSDLKERDKAEPNKAPWAATGGPSLPSYAKIQSQAEDFKTRPAKEKLTASETARLEKTLKRVKKLAIEILSDPPGRELTATDKNMIARIEKFHLSNLETKLAGAYCGDKASYYFVDPGSGEIGICPIMLEYSDDAILHVMGIFVGRGLMECGMKLSLGADPATGKGGIPPLDASKGQTHPMLALKSCLVKHGANLAKTNVNLSDPGPKAALYARAKFVRGLLPKEAKYSDDDIANFLKTEIPKKPECFAEIVGSQTDSAMADGFGAELLARHLKDPDGPKAKYDSATEQRTAPLSALLDFACRYPNSAEVSAEAGHIYDKADPLKRLKTGTLTNANLLNAMGCPKSASSGPSPFCPIREPASGAATIGPVAVPVAPEKKVD